VVVFDQRWHGQGISSPRFLLEDCADDVGALADALGVDTFVPVGFSMRALVVQRLATGVSAACRKPSVHGLGLWSQPHPISPTSCAITGSGRSASSAPPALTRWPAESWFRGQ
jgi:pimeloyl-ACP methyl ester carboxylesterase